ncbi:Transcription regulator Rua1, C-terminal [Fusarium oxysporum f. sp. vasinfectum]|nr:Transcription regulator Rua1, C-terminal [Fusarium oxysporum f. sp. vasinfectum]
MNSNQVTNKDFTPMSEELWRIQATQSEPQPKLICQECPFCGAAYLTSVSPLNLRYASYQQTLNGPVPTPGSTHKCPCCSMVINNSFWMEMRAGEELGLQDVGYSMPSGLDGHYSEHDTVTNEALIHIDACSDQHQISDDSISSFSASLFSSTNSPSPDWVSAQRGNPSMYSGQYSVVGATPPPLNYGDLQAMQQAPSVVTSTPMSQRNGMLLPTKLPSQTAQQKPWQSGTKCFASPSSLPFLVHCKPLPSNGDATCLNRHPTDVSEPPDLYAALREEPTPPLPEDMNHEDPDMIPREQELRCEGDLYTPRWVRGHGNKREGWCGICKPGRWLELKNSAFWYDKQFSHGISAATGSSFQEPQDKRCLDGSWEGRRKLPGSDMLISVTHSRQWNAGLIARALTPAKPKTKV